MNKEKYNDDFLKELIRLGSVEKAPEGFTDKVMQTIDPGIDTESQPWWSLSNIWFWASLFIGFAALVSIVFFVDFSFMGSVFTGFTVDENLINTITTEVGRELLGMSEGIEVSSITVIIVAAIGALFILDRILRRKPDVEFRVI